MTANNNNNTAPSVPLENPTHKLLLTNSLSVNNFKYHPKSVLSGITSSDGLSTVSLKSETAVDFVFKGELIMKMFSLLNEKIPVDQIIDLNVDPEDDILKSESTGSRSEDVLLSEFQKDIESLEAELKKLESKLNSLENNFNAGNRPGLDSVTSIDYSNSTDTPSLDLMRAIRDLASEFVLIENKAGKSVGDKVDDNDDIVMAEDSMDEEKSRIIRELNNNTIRSLFENTYKCKILIDENEESCQDKHLRVLRIGSVNLE